MRPSSKLIIAVLVPILVATAIAPLVFPAGSICESCHAPGKPEGNYVFAQPQLTFTSPSVVQPNSSVNVSLSVSHAGKYTVKSFTADLSLEGPGDLESGETSAKDIRNIGSEGGSAVIAWKVHAGSEGMLLVNASINYTAHFKHTNTQGNDEYPYQFLRALTVMVRPIALRISLSELSFSTGAGTSKTFELAALSEVKNITLKVSPNIAGAANVATTALGKLGAGERHTVTVNFLGGSEAINNGRIDLVWENATGVKDSGFVAVRVVQPPQQEAKSPVPLLGRATGLVSLGLLITSILLGLVKMGKARRARLHCAVSWFILGLSVYHGLILLLGPYSSLTLGTYVILGYASAAVMGVASVNGLLDKWMSRKLGYRTWLWLHRISTILAIVLIIVHAIMIGTDFKFLRGLAGGEGGGGNGRGD